MPRLHASRLATRLADLPFPPLRPVWALLPLLLAGCSGGAAPGTAGGESEPAEPTGQVAQASSTLTQVPSFGTNPGNLLMFDYVPQGMPTSAPLVLALHGCTQSASDYQSAGWNALADTYKFYVVYPQQQSANNTETCFNWFGNTSGSTADITRGQGEAESIIEMIDAMKAKYSIDPKRVYVNGFSAGAAYTVALLAMYPDVFAAGASFSGLPFGCANSLPTAETCMAAPTTKTGAAWASLAKAGFPSYAGPYPRLSVWQGSGDTTVSTGNLAAIVAQWTALTGAPAMPTTSNTVGGFPHNEYATSAGVQVESYSITGMTHAVSVDPTHGCGTAGTYYDNTQVCAVDLVAKFFGLEGAGGGGSSSGGGSSGGSSGSSSGGASGGSSGSSGSSGGAGSGSGGAGSSSGVVGVSGGSSGTGSGGAIDDDGGTGAGGNGAAADAGALPAAQLPGCSMAAGLTGAPKGDARGSGWVLVGLGLGVATMARRRSVR